jgi:glutamyl-tRNA(Gln) amidotransferase subunit E
MSSHYARHHLKTKEAVTYVPIYQATPETYKKLGFKCGLEIHQQLATKEKLFCRCPVGIYHDFEDYNAEILRHMRPTLSELGEYDGTALMEFKTRKNIYYRIKNETACTYDIDDTPPFPLNREALRFSLEIAHMLKLNIVGEVHIIRKQYLDGSIPTGFQRTAIIGLEGEIDLPEKKIRIIQMSLEEDSCREVSDIGHDRVYSTDRLGTPLIEMVTYPDMLTPFEAKEAGQYLRYLTRSSCRVRTGIGAARQDVNVSVTGGTRIEIKGVAHTKWIPRLTHNEAFRQWALLQIRDTLSTRIPDPDRWKITHTKIEGNAHGLRRDTEGELIGVNLPGFEGILSYFTQPGRAFINEISGRLKVIPCLGQPNLLHSEAMEGDMGEDGGFIPKGIPDELLKELRKILNPGPEDAQIVFFTPREDMQTALETIGERCRMAFTGVPEETRKALPDGTTIFERVLQRKNLFPLLQELSEKFGFTIRSGAILIGNIFKGVNRAYANFTIDKLLLLCQMVKDPVHTEGQDKSNDLLKLLIPRAAKNSWNRSDQLGTDFPHLTIEEVSGEIEELIKAFTSNKKDPGAKIRWIMGKIAPKAAGRVPLAELMAYISSVVEKEEGHDHS